MVHHKVEFIHVPLQRVPLPDPLPDPRVRPERMGPEFDLSAFLAEAYRYQKITRKRRRPNANISEQIRDRR